MLGVENLLVGISPSFSFSKTVVWPGCPVAAGGFTTFGRQKKTATTRVAFPTLYQNRTDCDSRNFPRRSCNKKFPAAAGKETFGAEISAAHQWAFVVAFVHVRHFVF